MKKLSRISVILLISSLTVLLSGCADIKKIANSLSNISKLDFTLDGVDKMKVEGIDVNRIQKLSDIKTLDGIKLANAYRNKRLNTSFIVNVKADNPNGTKKGEKSVSATIENLQWDLFIDGTKTISGDLANPVSVPGGGASEIIPLRISLDLVDYFGKRGYEDLVNLALNIGGLKSDPSTILLKAKPTVSTSFGPISYPGTIDITHTFSGK